METFDIVLYYPNYWDEETVTKFKAETQDKLPTWKILYLPDNVKLEKL